MTRSPSPFSSYERRATPGTALLAVILVLSLGAGIGLSPQAAAQVPVGGAAISGVVSDASGHPLQDVTVTAKKQITGSTWSYHEARTDASGLYAFEGLDGGTWNLSFQKDGYRTLHEEIELQLNTSEEQNASLQSILESTLHGTVYGSETGEPLSGAKIRVTTWNKESPEERNTSSDEDGKYEIPLFPGENEVMVTKKGFSNERFWVYGGQGDVTREAWLWPMPPQDSVIEGRVVDAETGEGIQAFVSIRPDYERAHHTDSGGSGTSTATYDVAEPAYSPRYHYNNHNSTVTDEDGRFRMDAHAGHVVIEANRAGYLIARANVELQQDSTESAELELEALPERSVTLSGTVKNAKNGSTLPGASVQVQVPEAGDHQWTNTDKDGRFEVQVRPGYTVIEVHYWGGHHSYEDAEVVAHDETASDSGDDAPANSSEPVTPEPADPEPPRDTTRYYPAIRSIDTQAESDHSLDIELHPEREATTTIVGYVVDSETGETVPGAHVNLQNHETSAWGSAVTDEHGSFRFETHGGYHTLRAYRDGYLYTAVNTIAPGSGTHRVDLEIREGQWVQAGWWSPDGGRDDDYHYGGGHPEPMPVYEEAASDGVAMDRSSGGMSRAPSMAGNEGSAGLQGGPGELGPYQGPENTEAPGPAAILVLLVGALVLAAIRARRDK